MSIDRLKDLIKIVLNNNNNPLRMFADPEQQQKKQQVAAGKVHYSTVIRCSMNLSALLLQNVAQTTVSLN